MSHPRLHLPLQSLEARQEKEGKAYPLLTNPFPCPGLPNECWPGKGKITMTGRAQLKTFLWSCPQVQHLQKTLKTRGFPSFSKVSELKAEREGDLSL